MSEAPTAPAPETGEKCPRGHEYAERTEVGPQGIVPVVFCPACEAQGSAVPQAPFGALISVMVGQNLLPEYAVVLDAYRRAQGSPPWLRRPAGPEPFPTAAEVNQAVDWWNAWQVGGPAEVSGA